MAILHLAMLGLFLLDLALPRNCGLLPYYFLVVVLAASFATPRRMVPLIAQAYGLAIASGVHWRVFPSIDSVIRLSVLTGVAAGAVVLAAQRSRETALWRRSERILSLTLDNAAAGEVLADASGRLMRVNPAFSAMLGRDAVALLQLSWSEITHPDDLAEERSLVEEMVARRRDGYRRKKRYLRGDGSAIWVDLSVSCARDPDGRLDFFIGQCIDITAQVAAQEALVQSDEILHRTLDHCSVGLALCAPGTGVVLQANPELCAELGLTATQLVGRSLAQVVGALEQVSAQNPAHGRPMDQAALESLLRGETDAHSMQVRLLRDGLQRGRGELRLSNLRDAAGALRHVLLELDDITDVVARTEYLQTAAAAGVVGIWDWDVPANVLTWDPVMYRLYGRDPGDFAGAYEAWVDAVHPDDRAYAEGEIQAALRGEREYAPRFRVIWPDGSVHHVQAGSRTFFDAGGRAVRMLGVNYDVTELVRTQERLQVEQLRLNATLDSLLDPQLILGPVHDAAGAIVDLRILRANPAAAAYNHMALEAFVGASVRQFWPEHVGNGLFDRYLEVLGSGRPLVLDSFPFLHAQQGGLRYLDIRAVKVGEELSITWRDVSDRIAMEQALEHRAATDSLTALLNREELFRLMERLLAGDQRKGGQLAVMFCDLDHFKEVNDRYGHQAGDAVLQTMADRIRSCLRASDLAARIGGDELMVVLPGVQGMDDAVTIAEKVRQVASQPVPTPAGEVGISLCVGVALASPGESLDTLIARADAAMYTAKQQGRDQVVAHAGGTP